MKGIVTAVIVITVLGIVGFVILPRQKTNTSPVNTTGQTTQESSLPKSQSKYIEYSENILERTLESNRILFFYANWCPTCRPVDKEISENINRIPDGFVIIRVNYNDDATDKVEKALAAKYGVTYQHTFVEIDKSGDVIQSWNGGNFDMLLSKLTQ